MAAAEVVIDRSPEGVFRFLIDYGNEVRWQVNVRESVSDPPGPARVGTDVQKERRTPMGEHRFTVRIVAVDEERHRRKDEIVSGLFRGTTGDWSVEPNGRRSRVRLVARMDAVWPWKVLLPIIDRSARKDLAAELGSLKAVPEGPAAP